MLDSNKWDFIKMNYGYWYCNLRYWWLAVLIIYGLVLFAETAAHAELIEPIQTCPPNTCPIYTAYTIGGYGINKMMCSTVCVSQPVKACIDRDCGASPYSGHGH